MIKRYFIFSLAATFLGIIPIRAQTVVSAPALEATSITGFLNQLEQTLNTLTAVKGQFEVAKEALNAIKEINTWISRGRYLEEAAQILADATDLAKRSYDLMINGRLYSPKSIGERLASMTRQLSRATAGFTLVVNAMSMDMKGSDADRFEMIERGLAIAREVNNLIRAWVNDDMAVAYLDAQIDNNLQYLEEFEYASAVRATLNASHPIYIHLPCLPSIVGSTSRNMEALTKGMDTEGDEEMNNLQATADNSGTAMKRVLKEQSAPINKFFYAACALMFLIGSGNVYIRFINGDDIYRPMAYWFISIIAVFVIGNLVSSFLS
jgi:hypothetical protein